MISGPMNPGPELDALIAEMIMGWKKQTAKTKDGSVEYWLGPNHENQMAPPAFSTDLAQAAKVSAWLQKRSPLVAMASVDPIDICVAALRAVPT